MMNARGEKLFRAHGQITANPRSYGKCRSLSTEPTFLTYAELRESIKWLNETYGVAPVTSEFTGPGMNLVEKFVWTVDKGSRVLTDVMWIQH